MGGVEWVGYAALAPGVGYAGVFWERDGGLWGKFYFGEGPVMA